MFHVKRCVGIKSFSDAKWMKKRAAGKIKSFLIQQFFKNVGEVWASSPHLRSKRNFAISGFPAAIALFETSQFGIGCFYETSCKFRQGNGAIAARWQAKAGVEPPFAGR